MPLICQLLCNHLNLCTHVYFGLVNASSRHTYRFGKTEAQPTLLNSTLLFKVLSGKGSHFRGFEADLDIGFNYTGPSTTKISDPQPTPSNVELEVSTKGAEWQAEVNIMARSPF